MNGVVGRDAARVPDQVHLAQVESQGTEEVESRVHARQHREVQLGFSRHLALTAASHVVRVVGYQVVDNTHGSILGSVVKYLRVAGFRRFATLTVGGDHGEYEHYSRGTASTGARSS